LLKNQSKVSSLKQFGLIFTELCEGKLPKFPLTAFTPIYERVSEDQEAGGAKEVQLPSLKEY
jgi:hypothetical protein